MIPVFLFLYLMLMCHPTSFSNFKIWIHLEANMRNLKIVYAIMAFLYPMCPLTSISQFIKSVFLKKCFYLNWTYFSANGDSKCAITLFNVSGSKHTKELFILSDGFIIILVFDWIDDINFIFNFFIKPKSFSLFYSQYLFFSLYLFCY